MDKSRASRMAPTPSAISTRGVSRVAALLLAAAMTVMMTACGAPPQAESTQGINTSIQEALKAEGPVEILDPACCEGSLYTEILQEVYTRAGGESKVTQIADVAQHFPLLARQPNGISPSMWDQSVPEQMKKYVDEEKSVLASPSDITAEEGWYVPDYVIHGDAARGIEPSCPGLPNWEALNGCAAAFATSETGSRGAYLAGGLDWEKYFGDKDRIKNLKLDYDVVYTGSEAALTAAIKRKYDRGEPFLALAWTPHYVTSKYNMTRIDFPPYTAECWETTYACQWPEITLFKIMSKEFPTSHPTAYAIAENSDLNAQDITAMMTELEEKGKSYSEVASEWLDNNPDRWQSWLPDSSKTAG